jgi:uncharacterized protein involved in exopolysaccharide biosynthesis
MPDSNISQRKLSRDSASTALRDHEEYEDLNLEHEAPPTDWWHRASEVVLLFGEHRAFLIRCVVVGLIVSAAVAFLIPKRYESTARLMPPDNQTNSLLSMLMGGVGDKLPSIATSGLLGMKTSGQLFVGVLQSRTIEDKLINDFDLRKVYWDRYWEDARKDLERRTDITEDKKSGIISITVTDKDPDRAARMASAYVNELNRVMSQVSTSAARRERIFIESRLKDVRADLNAASEKFSRFASKNSALDIKEQTIVMVGAAADLQGQLIAAQSELQGLSQVYGPDNIRVRAVSAKIASLRHELEKMAGSSDPSKTLQEDGLYPSIRKLPMLGVEWANLYRDAKVQEKILELLTQQYELAKIQEAKEIPSVKVLDEPIPPQKKVWPPRGIIIGTGVLLSFLLPLAWFWFQRPWQAMPESAPPKQFADTMLRVFGSSKQRDSDKRAAGA